MSYATTRAGGDGGEGGLDAQRPGQRVARAHAARLCERCGRRFEPGRPHQVFCEPACRCAAWQARQTSLLDDPQPLPPVVDQRVPAREARRLCRMSRAILAELEQTSLAAPAQASTLQALFPHARSVRTRISDVAAWLLAQDPPRKLRSKPAAGVVGEWLYWIEAL